MQHCDTLIAPRWCIPVDPAESVLKEHAVIVSDGRIVDVLPLAEARQQYQPSATLDRPDHALIPGLVNAHAHSAMTLFRGLADDLPLETWLEEKIWPVEARFVSPEMVRDGTELAIAEMIRGGTTCFSDQYFFPEIVAETAVDLQMRAMVGTPVIDPPTPWSANAAECLAKGNDLVHDPYRNHPLVSTCFVPHSTYVLSDESLTELRVLADQTERRIQIHLHESAAEVEGSVAQTGLRPYERLERLGLVNASLLAVHAVHMSDAEIARFAEVGVSIAHCPHSNLKLASGMAPIAKYLAAGVNVAIGTDGAASNNTLDMLAEMRTAALLAKAVAGDAAVVSAGQALHMATMGGAIALGLQDTIGSIEPGKWADLACIDLGALNTQPVFDAVSQIVYAARAEQISDVWIAGRHQLEHGRLTGISLDSLAERSNEWRERIASGSTDE